MTINFGMVTNMEDIKAIKNGEKVTWTEKRTDRDGWTYEETMTGYDYDGKRFTIGTDRDGWPVAMVVR